MSSKLIKMIKDLTLNTYTLLPKCLLQEKQPCVVFVWQRHLAGAFVQQQIKLHSVFTGMKYCWRYYGISAYQKCTSLIK